LNANDLVRRKHSTVQSIEVKITNIKRLLFLTFARLTAAYQSTSNL